MVGGHRKPIADAFWADAEPDVRMGERAETFREFSQRVDRSHDSFLADVADGSVFFGHGMWMAMLFRRIAGFIEDGTLGMKTFRRFQQCYPMPDGAVYLLRELSPGRWTIECDQTVLRQMIALAGSDPSKTT